MRESAKISYSYVRSKSRHLGIDPGVFEDVDIHLHVPADAIPKDGLSAGLTMEMATASLFSDRQVRSNIGLTGEITLRGRVLPVGGIKMKNLEAHRAGLDTVILPKWNEHDLAELPEEVQNAMTFIPVESIDDAIDVALRPQKKLHEAHVIKRVQ